MMATLLVIDDEPSVGYSFRRVFESDRVRVHTALTAREGLEKVGSTKPDVVLLDLQLPDRTGLDLFREIQALDPKRPVIIITAHGTTETAIEAMKGGAFDYLVKPVNLERLSQILDRAFEATRLMHAPAVLPAEDSGDRIVGRSAVMQEMCKDIGRIAPQDVNVLILGESGTGKELVARALYQHSARAARPFLAVNCAAIPETLLESELFGHEQGAFTGAQRRRIGKFEQCNGGTIFLDEIGDMPLPAQAKILRLLQEQRFERVGGTETVQTRVRVLAASNQDLERGIAEGQFRQDLYYRLKVVTIAVPPLREREGDVAELAHHFLFQFNGELGMSVQGFDPETLACLRQFNWPGNVRQLQSVIKEAMLHSTGPILLPEFLPTAVRIGSAGGAEPQTSPAGAPDLTATINDLLKRGEKDLYSKVMRIVESALFARVLQETHGHQGSASELLGLHRSTLRYKLRDLGLSVDRTGSEDTISKDPASDSTPPPKSP
jgi:two-component system nitrogen regulation response regulator GlnG